MLILAKKKENKKQDKKTDETDKALIYVIMIIVVIFSIFGYFIFKNKDAVSETEDVIYKDFVFQKNGDFWSTRVRVTTSLDDTIRDYNVHFHVTPYEVENIQTIKSTTNVSMGLNYISGAEKIYITTDPEYPASVVLGAVQLAKILGNIYQKDVSSAVTREDNRTESPLITCEDSDMETVVIHMNLGNTTSIYRDGSCIVVQGRDPFELVLAAERYSFELLGIM